MTWNPLANPQDFIMLGGKKSPGVAVVSGWRRPRRWQQVGGYGLSGASLRYLGMPLLRGKVSLTFTTTEDFDVWETFRELFTPLPPRPATNTDVIFLRQRGTFLDVSHPQLDELGVHRVALEEDGQLEPLDETGKWGLELALIEVRAPVVTLARPTASTAAVPQLTARQQEIERLRLENEDLAQQVARRERRP